MGPSKYSLRPEQEIVESLALGEVCDEVDGEACKEQEEWDEISEWSAGLQVAPFSVSTDKKVTILIVSCCSSSVADFLRRKLSTATAQ